MPALPVLKASRPHFCTILRWEPFHYSHPTIFRHPELVSGSPERCLSTSPLRFRNKFGMTAGFFTTLQLNNPKTAPHPPSPTWGRSSRCNTLVLLTNADGERPQTIFKKPKNPHLDTILRWEPFHYSHPAIFRHPELVSGSPERCLSTSPLRFRNKFGMTAGFFTTLQLNNPKIALHPAPPKKKSPFSLKERDFALCCSPPTHFSVIG